MSENKSLSNEFRLLYPFFSVIILLIMIAVIFNTFDLGIDCAIYNLLLFLPVYGVSLIVIRRPHWAVILSGLFGFLLFYIDQYIYSIRLTHIRYSDFNLIAQAARVAGRYHPIWNTEIARRLVIFIALSAFLFFIYRYYKLNYSKKAILIMGIVILFASTIMILCGAIPVSSQEDFNFTAETDKRGLLYSMYCQAKSEALKAPDGYSTIAAKSVINRYQASEGSNDIRLIVIMNESLADYSLIGETHFKSPLPFIHSLNRNCLEGKLAVSVFGGGTSTTEFEFLTGCSAAFLPEGCTPYLQYVNHKMENIVSDLGKRSKIAIHPYYSEEWNRTQVYQFFGFDRFVSGADFGSTVVIKGKEATSPVSRESIISFGEGPLYFRGLISDRTCYERILSEDADFTFAVTMQNHGDYAYSGDDFVNDTYVTPSDRQARTGKPNMNSLLYGVNSGNVEQEVHDVNQYLTLSNLSDQAFAYLLGELEKSDQKTIVLMFGDHQPGLMIPEHYVDCEESPDMDYIVPYILWANYDIEFDAPEYTSPNYLSAILKKNAGLPLTAWDQFRLDVMQEYPVVTANFIIDRNGDQVNKDGLRDYEYAQYMRMFG